MENKFVVKNDDVNKRLDVFLNENVKDLSRSQIKNLIDEDKILINGSFPKKSGDKLKLNQIIEILPYEKKEIDLTPQKIDFEIVFENSNLLVINKPQNLVVHPGGGSYCNTLVNGLIYKNLELSDVNSSFRPGIIHRLDKDTSGLMLVAKNNLAHMSLAKQIEEKTCVRKYLALLEGVVKEDRIIETYIDRDPKNRKKMAVSSTGKKAISILKVVENYNNYTLCEFTLKTGRTHQIRVHSNYIGHPVVGDKTYGYKNQKFNLEGQLLHSYYIEFNEPSTNERLSFKIELPTYFKEVLSKLHKH